MNDASAKWIEASALVRFPPGRVAMKRTKNSEPQKQRSQ